MFWGIPMEQQHSVAMGAPLLEGIWLLPSAKPDPTALATDRLNFMDNQGMGAKMLHKYKVECYLCTSCFPFPWSLVQFTVSFLKTLGSKCWISSWNNGAWSYQVGILLFADHFQILQSSTKIRASSCCPGPFNRFSAILLRQPAPSRYTTPASGTVCYWSCGPVCVGWSKKTSWKERSSQCCRTEEKTLEMGRHCWGTAR